MPEPLLYKDVLERIDEEQHTIVTNEDLSNLGYYKSGKTESNKQRWILKKVQRVASAEYRKENPEYDVKYRKVHYEEIKVLLAKYYKAHREVIIARSREYSKKHPEEVKARHVKWRKKHPEGRKVIDARYRKVHREAIKAISVKRERDLGYTLLMPLQYGEVGHHVTNEYVIGIPERTHQIFSGKRKKHRALVLQWLKANDTEKYKLVLEVL